MGDDLVKRLDDHLPGAGSTLPHAKLQLEARHAIVRLRDALQPFADFAVDRAPADHVITQGSSMAKRQLTMGDCQRARRMIAKLAYGGKQKNQADG